MKTVGDIMTRKVLTVSMDDDVSLLSTLLETRGFKHYPVIDDEGTLVGIISERDIEHHLSPFIHTPAETRRDEALLHKRAHQIMTRHPVTARPDDAIDYVARLMLFNNISSIPITDDNALLKGLVSWVDLLCHYTRH